MKVKEFATVVSGATPSSEHPEYYGGNIVWFTPKDLSDQNTKYVSVGERTITQEGYNSCSTTLLPAGSLLMSSRAPIGLLAISTVSCCTNQGFKSFDIDKTMCDPEYLYYYLKYHIKEIEALGSGTTFKEVSKESVENYDIFLPKLDIQHTIVQVLRDIDDKILGNNAICADLDAMAKLLYGYWFVQFDFPDENGKPYKSSGGKMVWNEDLKWEIPEGWKIGKIKDVISHINTGLNPRHNFILNNGNIKYITVKNLTTEGTIDFTTCDTIDEDALTKVHRRSDIAKGDILFASIAPLGRCVVIREEPKGWDINESVFSIRPKNENLSEYLYMFFMSEYFIKKAEHSSTGSVFNGIRISVLEDMKIVVPPENVLDEFSKTISPILDLKYQNEMENQKLREIRDFLLPLLMNGQARIIE